MTAIQVQSVGPIPTQFGAEILNLILSLPTALMVQQIVELAPGDNVFPIPTFPHSLLIIIPPVTNTHSFTVRTLVGDTGIACAAALPVIFSSQQVNVYINPGGSIIDNVALIWI